MSERILVTGIGGPAGKSASAFFRERGYHIIGTDVRPVSGLSDTFLNVPFASAPEFPSALLRIIRDHGPGLFVPTVTEELFLVAQLKKEIEALGCEVYISTPEAVEIANDKFKTAMFMKGRGVSVPVTFSGSDEREKVVSALGLPLLAKPSFGRGGRGVTLYERKEDVLSETRDGLIFQEFIPGVEFDVNLFVDKGGEVKAAVALKKTAMKEGIVGNALNVERAEMKEAVDLAVKAASLLGLEGPLDFDIRLRSDGKPALLEINARLGGNSLSAMEVLDELERSYLEKRRSTTVI